METPSTVTEVTTMTTEIPIIIARDNYIESNHEHDATLEALLQPSTPTDVLVEIGERLPFFYLEEFAPLLVAHPNFTKELLDRIVGALKIQWWGDDPIECRIAWETLEREYLSLQGNTGANFQI
jgi:hypothetical protein